MLDSGASPRRLRFLAGLRLLPAVIVLLFLLRLATYAEGQGWVTESPGKVEAAFLRNFAHYVAWPPDAFDDPHAPWRIGVLGRDPFGEALDKTFEGRTEQGRPFSIYRAKTLDQLPRCQIIFIAHDDSQRVRAVLDELKGKPVLTVGDAPDFLEDGGIIRFRLRDRVLMSINLDQARAVSLKIQTKMLEVADEVLENGVVRKVR